ncbi:hypothetical protein CFP56_009516 [Quercus suber]|uniref:Transmembrane protein n=1 Tax=Quercus suber TaxID=58331 RepID=A0AAW0M6K4_QUESU
MVITKWRQFKILSISFGELVAGFVIWGMVVWGRESKKLKERGERKERKKDKEKKGNLSRLVNTVFNDFYILFRLHWTSQKQKEVWRIYASCKSPSKMSACFIFVRNVQYVHINIIYLYNIAEPKIFDERSFILMIN